MKAPGDKRRREKTQLKRLVALGMEEDKAKKLTTGAVRAALRHPEAVKKAAAPKA